MPVKLSDYVFQFVAAQGVKHVFMLIGGGAMHLNDSVGKAKGIEYVCTLHEQTAAIAADAYAHYSNNLGVALVTTGPGGTNSITGVAASWLESIPCLIISGQVKREDLKKDLPVRQIGLQELDIVNIVKSITKYAVTVIDPQTIRYHLEKAVAVARSGRKGPVWIDIPLDVQAAMIEPEKLDRYNPDETTPVRGSDEEFSKQICKAVELLNQSDRPVLLLGSGVRLSGGQEQIDKFIQELNIPVLTTWMGSDLVAGDNPLYFGKPGTLASRGANFIIQNSDLLLSIGARLDFSVTGFDQSKFARAAKKVVVDVDAGEFEKLKMKIDLSICTEAKEFINQVLEQRSLLQDKNREQWLDRCHDWKQKYPVVLPEYWNEKGYVNSYVFTSVLSELLTKDDLIISGSSGTEIEIFWLTFNQKAGQRAFCSAALGSIGFGIPASIGGCIASGRKRTITVDGDGSFQPNIQDLETVARLNLPIKYFVMNNKGYGSNRISQRTHFHGHLVGCQPSCGLTFPDTIKIAKAYGINSVRIKNNKNLRENIKKVLDMPGPTICEVIVNPDHITSPRLSSHVQPDGSMVSRPLEDLWPFLSREELSANMIVPLLKESEFD